MKVPIGRFPMTRFLLLASLLLACIACSTTGSGDRADVAASPGAPKVVTLRDHRSNLRLGIVNDGFLAGRGFEGETPNERKVSYYSTPGNDLMIKVASDRLVDGLIDFLEGQGFTEHSIPGPAPSEEIDSVAGKSLSTSLEIVRDGRARTWAYNLEWARACSLPRVATRYREARDVFLDIHRELEQYATGGVDDWDFSGSKVKRAR